MFNSCSSVSVIWLEYLEFYVYKLYLLIGVKASIEFCVYEILI